MRPPWWCSGRGSASRSGRGSASDSDRVSASGSGRVSASDSDRRIDPMKRQTKDLNNGSNSCLVAGLAGSG